MTGCIHSLCLLAGGTEHLVSTLFDRVRAACVVTVLILTETDTVFSSAVDNGGELDRGPEPDKPRRDRPLVVKLILLR